MKGPSSILLVALPRRAWNTMESGRFNGNFCSIDAIDSILVWMLSNTAFIGPLSSDFLSSSNQS